MQIYVFAKMTTNRMVSVKCQPRIRDLEKRRKTVTTTTGVERDFGWRETRFKARVGSDNYRTNVANIQKPNYQRTFNSRSTRDSTL